MVAGGESPRRGRFQKPNRPGGGGGTRIIGWSRAPSGRITRFLLLRGLAPPAIDPSSLRDDLRRFRIDLAQLQDVRQYSIRYS